MNRYQIHLTKTIETEITVETENEQIARNYALSRPHEHFMWRIPRDAKIVHLDVLDVVDHDDNPGE